MPRKLVEVGVVADDEEVFVVVGTRERSFWKSLRVASGARALESRICGLVAGLGADEGGGLQAALERAGDDEVELYLQCVQYMGELEAVALAVFVEGAFERRGVGFWRAGAGAGVAEDEEIHRPVFIVEQSFPVVFAG